MSPATRLALHGAGGETANEVYGYDCRDAVFRVYATVRVPTVQVTYAQGYVAFMHECVGNVRSHWCRTCKALE